METNEDQLRRIRTLEATRGLAPNKDEKAALMGTSGTPGVDNAFVTASDTRHEIPVTGVFWQFGNVDPATLLNYGTWVYVGAYGVLTAWRRTA